MNRLTLGLLLLIAISEVPVTLADEAIPHPPFRSYSVQPMPALEAERQVNGPWLAFCRKSISRAYNKIERNTFTNRVLTCEMVVKPTGEIGSVSILKTSGFPLTDRTALDLLKSVGRFQSLPRPGWSAERTLWIEFSDGSFDVKQAPL